MGILRCKFLEDVGKKRLAADYEYYGKEQAPIKIRHTKIKRNVNHGGGAGLYKQAAVRVVSPRSGSRRSNSCKHTRTAVNCRRKL